MVNQQFLTANISDLTGVFSSNYLTISPHYLLMNLLLIISQLNQEVPIDEHFTFFGDGRFTGR